MKFTVNIERENNPSYTGEWSSVRFIQLTSLLHPKEGTTVVLSQYAATMLRCCYEMSENYITIDEDTKIKYIINTDFEGVSFEYLDDNDMIVTVSADNLIEKEMF